VVNNGSKSGTGSMSLSNEQVMKLLNLLNDKPGTSALANMAGWNSCSFFNCSVFFNQHFYKFFGANIKLDGVNYHLGWIIDSGANQHLTNSPLNMHNLIDISELKIIVGHPNGTSAKVTHVGNLKLNDHVVLFDVLVVPEYCVSLMSVNKLIKDSKLRVGFDETKCYIQDLNQQRVLGTGSESGGLYLFDKSKVSSACVIKSEFLSCFVSKDVWHSRLGHPANQVLKLLKGSLKLTHIDHGAPCDVCHKAKQTRDLFHLSEHKTSVFGDLIHLDVWGPYKVVSREGFRFFLTIVDDFSRSVWVYMLKGKHEVFEMFKSFFKMILTQFNKKN
jgi:hypothetical protein